MRLPTPHVRPVTFAPDTAYYQARDHYASLGLDIAEDIVEYLNHGVILNTPNCFALLRVINLQPEESRMVEPAWFIRYARGNLVQLLQSLVLHCPLCTYIVWCRNNEGNGTVLRKWKTERLLRLATSTHFTKIMSTPRKVEVEKWAAA